MVCRLAALVALGNRLKMHNLRPPPQTCWIRMCILTGTPDGHKHFKVWGHWCKSQLDLDSFQYQSLEGRGLKDKEGKQSLSQEDILFPPRCNAAGFGRAPPLPNPLPAPPGQDPKAAGPAKPRNDTAAAAQAATPLPRPAVLYLLHGTGRHAEGRTWVPVARLSAREAQGRGREKA